MHHQEPDWVSAMSAVRATPQQTRLRSADAQRVPPHDLMAEMSVLGAMLLSRDAVADSLELVTAEDFYKPAHSHVFEAIANLDAHGDAADLVSVASQLQRMKLYDAIGGHELLLDLQGSVAATSNAARYARTVAELAQLRRMIGVAGEIAELGYAAPDDVDGAVDRAEQLVHDLTDRARPQRTPTIDEDVDDFFTRLEQRAAGEGVNGTPSGFWDLDELLTGFHPGQLVMVAARPGQGKTALSIGCALGAATEGHPVLFFSLEMSRGELVDRMHSREARVAHDVIRRGSVPPRDWPRINEAAARIAAMPIQIEDDSTITLPRIRAVTRRALRRFGHLDLVVVDYLQLMTPASSRENRQVEVAEISRGLKVMARELGVPVLALSQLNRNLEIRADKRPVLADLRDSGALEQDSDVVAFVFREETYKKDTKKPGVAEIIVAKHRNGPTGTVELAFVGQYVSFHNMARVQ